MPSHKIIKQHQDKTNSDYCSESKSNPVKGLQDRTVDNTNIARVPEVGHSLIDKVIDAFTE
ncbi:hypothetical protein QBE52_04590 [Clostridiaceae bacterium 35-E11]